MKSELVRDEANRSIKNSAGRPGLNRLYTKYYRLTTNLPSTLVERSLQINLFMQNKAKFRKSQMNVNKVLTKDYENETLGEHGKKQSQTKPNKANLLKAKMNVNFYSTKDYENKLNWAICENEPKTNPIQSQTKPISEAKKCCCV